MVTNTKVIVALIVVLAMLQIVSDIAAAICFSEQQAWTNAQVQYDVRTTTLLLAKMNK